MPFTAYDLRHRVEQSFPLLYAYLHRNAQRYLGPLQYDAFEVDTVVGHVVEQLVRLGILGGGDRTPPGAIDRLTDAQFYAFLNRSVRNKAIDRLRKRRFPLHMTIELEAFDETEGEESPLNDAVASIWGTIPFATPEEITLLACTQRELHAMLKHCIMSLEKAPHQFQAVLQELHEFGVDDLLQELATIFDTTLSGNDETAAHMSQHKDHAHKKLRYCLQQQSTNLAVKTALRITECRKNSTDTPGYAIDVHMLVQGEHSENEMRAGLRVLESEGLLSWHSEDVVYLTSAQMKRLTRFFKQE